MIINYMSDNFQDRYGDYVSITDGFPLMVSADIPNNLWDELEEINKAYKNNVPGNRIMFKKDVKLEITQSMMTGKKMATKTVEECRKYMPELNDMSDEKVIEIRDFLAKIE